MPAYIIFILSFTLLVVAAYLKLKEPFIIGKMGEDFVSGKLSKLDPAHYIVLNDLLLSSNGSLNSTQIDHVVVSNYGIFCIETKAYKGWIFGNANQQYWTQTIYRHRERFYNPLRQNYAHIRAIEELIKPFYPNIPIVPLIAFPNAEKLRIYGTNATGDTRAIIDKIKYRKMQVLSNTDRDKIHDILTNANIQDKETRKLHNNGVKNLKNLRRF